MVRAWSTLLVVALLAPFAVALLAPPPGPRVDPDLALALERGAPGPLPLLVEFDSHERALATLRQLGDRPGVALRTIPFAAFEATPAEAARLLRMPGVVRVDLDEPLKLALSTATVATRAKAVWGSVDAGPVLDANGSVIDGTGVGIAVVDTGVDGTHPDLAPNLAANYKVIGVASLVNLAAEIAAESPAPSMLDLFISAPTSDTTSGHGTHVASIAAGTGAASGGKNKGAAPGAKLYAFGSGEGLTVLTAHAAASFEWVLLHHDQVSPPIRVVTNSWGGEGPYDPDFILNRLTTQLVQESIVVVWIAGNGDALNNGGTGAVDLVNQFAKNPTPGVIGVANYDDAGTGTRDGALAPSSSRGLSTDASTWPDISAPGTDIAAAFTPTNALGWASQTRGVLAAAGALLIGSFNSSTLDDGTNRHTSHASFRLGGVEGPSQRIDFFHNPFHLALYNGHRGAFVTTGEYDFLDPTEVPQVRFFWPAFEAAGPFQPLAASTASVEPGDAIVLRDNGGTANPVQVLVVAPDGASARVAVHFPCETGCDAQIDLDALFHGHPRDGTWMLGNGGSGVGADPGPLMEALNPYYVEMSGTSMAAPHVAGVIALLLQADPALTPAQVEDILEDTAYKFSFGAAYASDPANAGSTSSFDKGHGLVDARAAVDFALSS